MADRSGNVAVALLYESRERGAHVRDALTALGASVVYETSTHSLDRAELERSQANVVVVNLDAQSDPGSGEVDGLLDDARYRVVFNDGEVSRALSGWDQARWTRHLAAKIFPDTDDLDPPRPLDAESVPVPARRSTPPADADSEAASLAPGLPVEAPAHDAAAAAAHDSAITDAMELLQSSQWSAQDEPARTRDLPAAADAASAYSALDLDELIDLPSTPPAAVEHDFDALFAQTQSPAEHVAEPAEHASASTNDFDLADIEDLLGGYDAAARSEGGAQPDANAFAQADSPLHSPPDEFVIDAADDFSGEATEPAGAAFDLVFDDAEIDTEAEPIPTAPAAASPPSKDKVSVPLDWSLEDMVGDLDAPAPPPAAATDRADFGIEKLSAAQFLAPQIDPDEAAAVDDGEPTLDLELMPLEEAVAPVSVEETISESWLIAARAKAKVRRVWVLGASIGGPESVREFLAQFPRDYPALFLLAQHLGDEFVEMMMRQLAKATPLIVRAPSHGDRVSHGEVVVVPANQHLIVDPDGVVVLERLDEETPHSPSIDRVMADVAERFGAGAGAIVFSGMSNDAVEGSRHIVAGGGRVYAQSPETCVVSSMVDAVIEAGMVGFVGSPKELAEKLLSESKSP